ncbi:ATP-utilizing chromatin assembly and remodelling N-terminal-domain-containing protein [Crucibulum laeve]|uniref:ATP-utilizing chromatin assembly and remodelling N-terminal-domain-containing protein n=1 Tax=Crucibulum laeve TaxID=68775 RepID=A0A5C3M8H9_9AGAR|nr:ATP-utilizing chromatin assembly and remodelling N-terminal-domain-containing protein [Crucibulum laeve]
MPTCRRKRVVLTEPSDALLQAVKSDPHKPVFYLEQTGEIFDTYEAYAARMSFYRLKQFQCEVTGKSGLDYFQAVESERQEARTLHSRFSESLKPAVLKAVQWQVMGRLDHLVEAVYERFKDRYFKGERVLVDLSGTKYYARVEKVYPPKYSSDTSARDAHKDDDFASGNSLEDEVPHSIGGDLKIPAKDATIRDEPDLYFYWVQIMELEKDKSDKGKGSSKNSKLDKDGELTGSLMEVKCYMMSRDRLSFSKSILRRFIRDCVDREAAVASPWIVKPTIAKRYGVDSIMPEETRKGVENIKKGEIDKRKKAWEDKEGPPTKKQKKMTAAQEERVKNLAAVAERKEREAREKAEKQRVAKEEAERLAAEKKKKKPVRYPTEDLDIRMSEKDKKAGLKIKRPFANRAILPFNAVPGTFETFLMGWNFLVVYGTPLHLSVFTLDEFEHALRHSVADPPCSLLAEIHSTLIYNLRTVSFQRHSAILSLLQLKENLESTGRPDEKLFGVSIEELTAVMADIGNNWERVPLRHTEGREGWEEALLGCLKDHATLSNFPRLREILTRLLFAPEASTAPVSCSSSSRSETPLTPLLVMASTPGERYYALPPEDRIAIISFMCNLAISSKAIHTYMESCEEQLTALRKEKIEVNRLKKQYIEEMNVLLGETKEDTANTPSGVNEDVIMQDLSELSEVSDGGSDSAGKRNSKAKDVRGKTAHAKEREAARARQASVKQALAEHRRLDEEVNKLERRLEGIEREFRKLLGGVRVKPLGRDRFYNRIWWFDGMGSASLVGSGGVAQYGTGRIFIQGPSEFDLDLLRKRKEEGEEDGTLEDRRREEEGEECMLGSNDWAVYSDLDELDEFVAWLNPKGHRELALKTALSKWWVHITAGMRKRLADLNVSAKLPDARRSARTKAVAGYDLSREPYMLWTNRRAVNYAS